MVQRSRYRRSGAGQLQDSRLVIVTIAERHLAQQPVGLWFCPGLWLYRRSALF